LKKEIRIFSVLRMVVSVYSLDDGRVVLKPLLVEALVHSIVVENISADSLNVAHEDDGAFEEAQLVRSTGDDLTRS
jgi:hypothetical protein